MADSPRPDGIYVHPQALCESSTIGAGTRVWAFAHILPRAVLGADCNVCDHVFIENAVVIGNRVTIKSGVQLWDGLRVGDDVFIGPNATFSNDKYPRSKHYQAAQPTHIDRGASIGSGAVVLPGIRIGTEAMVGAGAIVTRDVPARAIVSGNPARITGYVDTPRTDAQNRGDASVGDAGPPVALTSVRGVTRHRLTRVEDLRGALTAGEFPRDIPFEPKRYFIVSEVPGKEVRGEHAHRKCKQFLVCIRGSVSVVVDDGAKAEEIELSQSHHGLYIPPMTWAVQYRYSPDAMLLVFASDYYDAADYVRDYEEFRALVAG